jgi:hypothetical protein
VEVSALSDHAAGLVHSPLALWIATGLLPLLLDAREGRALEEATAATHWDRGAAVLGKEVCCASRSAARRAARACLILIAVCFIKPESEPVSLGTQNSPFLF